MAVFCKPRRNSLLIGFIFIFLIFIYHTKLKLHTKIKTDVIFLIFSSPENVDRRNAIRDTWFSERPENIYVFFAIGLKNSNSEELLLKENVAQDDLLLLDFVDDYSTLTEKLARSITHLVENYEFKFIFKGDDDTYVRLKPFLSLLARQSRHKLYWGFFVGNSRVKSSGKWEENSWFLCDRYLPYARGGGYVISQDIAKYISVNSEFLEFYQNEDVSLGVWLSALKIERRHERKFNTEYKSRGCNNNYLVMHKTSLQQMHQLSKNIKEVGELCTEEYKNMPSYEYNWSVPPSMCCLRNNQSNFY